MLFIADLCCLCICSVDLCHFFLERFHIFLKLSLLCCSCVCPGRQLILGGGLDLKRLLTLSNFSITECFLSGFLLRFLEQFLNHLLDQALHLTQRIHGGSACHLHESIAVELV